MDARSLCVCSYCEEKQPPVFFSAYHFPSVSESTPATVLAFLPEIKKNKKKSMSLSFKHKIRSE